MKSLSTAIALVAISATATALHAQDLYGGGVIETTGGTHGEQLLPYDSQHPWMHGYWQEMPAYGGYNAFRPYNYKQVLPQVRTSGGWGMSPGMPYSQQYWHKYRAQGTMSRHFSAMAPYRRTMNFARTPVQPARRTYPVQVQPAHVPTLQPAQSQQPYYEQIDPRTIGPAQPGPAVIAPPRVQGVGYTVPARISPRLP